MSHWILQSSFEPRSALHRISELLKQNADELCVELGLSHHHERALSGWQPDRSNEFISKVEELIDREDLESEMSDLRHGKSMLRFLGEERVVAKQQKIKAKLQAMPTRHDFIRWYYHHPRIWLLAFVRDAALDASRTADADWIQVDDNDDQLAPTSSLLVRSDMNVAKRYITTFQSEWANLTPEFILNHLDGHRSLRFDSENKIVSYCESIALPDASV